MPAASRKSCGAPVTAIGFSPDTNSRPRAGLSDHPGMNSATPSAPVHAAARQRGPSSRPSGKSRKISIMASALGSQDQTPTHSSVGPAGHPSSAALRPQPCAPSDAALERAAPRNSQPIGLCG